MSILLLLLLFQNPSQGQDQVENQTRKKAIFIDRVAVKVNDKIITERELIQSYKRERSLVLEQFTGAQLDRKLKELWKDIVLQAEETLLLFEKAVELGMAVSEDDARSQLMAIKEANGLSDEEFEETLLEQTGMSLSEYVDFRRRQGSAQTVVQAQVVSKIHVEESEVAKFYDEHQDEFLNPETYRIAEIVFLKGEEDSQAAQKRAHACQKYLAGDSFEEAARRFSDSLSKENGGDLGVVEFGTFRKEIEDKVRTMKVDDVSEPFETTTAFFIIKLLERTPVAPKPLDEVREDILERLRMPRIKTSMDEFIADLRDRYLLVTYLKTPPWYLEL